MPEPAMIGSSLAHYEIIEQLGEGGMGIVYKARDTRLDRLVAVKILPPDAMADPQRKQRFVQEARSASALNHPHIVTIYDINSENGIDFIAMEFIPGETLDRLIARRELRLKDTLKYAAQIADALARAHGAGIVHRDLKPGNVMVSDAMVKVLDFGLAKLVESGDSGALDVTRSMRPAETPRTEAGTILGTIAYMSPEQAEGRKLDARSDIFSFGSMLYEMIAGKRAFQGETRMSTLAAILTRDPEIPVDVSAALPPELERIVRRSMRKDPARRFQTMADLKVALEEVRDEAETGSFARPLAAAAPRLRSHSKLWISGAAVAVLCAIAATAWWIGRTPSAVRAPSIYRVTADSGLAIDPAVSANGGLLAYASDRTGNLNIWVQPIPNGEPVRVTRGEADDHEPDFSPDGSRIVFRSEREGGGVYVVPALGGADRLLAPKGRRPRFSPDGKWISYLMGGRGSGSRKLYVMAAGGGQPRALDTDWTISDAPAWSPDAKYLLAYGYQSNLPPDQRADWLLIPLDADGKPGAPIRTGALADIRKAGLRDATPERWIAAGDRILFSGDSGDSTNIWEAHLSLPSHRLRGTPRQLTSGPGSNRAAAAAGAAAAKSGVFFSNLSEAINIWSLALDANQGAVRGQPVQLTSSAAVDRWPSLSRDGKRMAFLSTRSGSADVWFKDLETGVETQLTATPENENTAEISPDGGKVVFSKLGSHALYVVGSRGGVPVTICERCGARVSQWSADGKTLLAPGRTGESISLLNIASGRAVEILKHPEHRLYLAHFSPDEAWISFIAWMDADRTREIIAPLHGAAAIDPKEWIDITDGDAVDEENAWSPDGSLLYFVSERDGFRCVYARRLDPRTKHPQGPLLSVQHFHRTRLSMIGTASSPANIALANNTLVFSMRQLRGNIWVLRD